MQGVTFTSSPKRKKLLTAHKGQPVSQQEFEADNSPLARQPDCVGFENQPLLQQQRNPQPGCIEHHIDIIPVLLQQFETVTTGESSASHQPDGIEIEGQSILQQQFETTTVRDESSPAHQPDCIEIEGQSNLQQQFETTVRDESLTPSVPSYIEIEDQPLLQQKHDSQPDCTEHDIVPDLQQQFKPLTVSE